MYWPCNEMSRPLVFVTRYDGFATIASRSLELKGPSMVLLSAITT